MEQLRKQLEQLRERLLNIKNSFLKPKIEIPSIHTKRGRLYRSAKNCLGQDVSLTEDELGCVESLREVAIRAGIFIRENKSTIGLLKELNNSNKFKRVDRPLIGDIILTPTKGKNIGHCGILGLNFKIFSNNSRNSLWDTYFNMLTWEIYYEQNKKLTTYYFRVLDSRVVGSAKLKNNNMKVTKVFGGAFASSVDPEKISLTIKSLIPLILVLLPIFGIVNIGRGDLIQAVEAIVAVISSFGVLWGIVRKFKK